MSGARGLSTDRMDAKVGDWVVTPRRGKAVEINARWYNALRLLEGWVRAAQDEPTARLAEHAELAYQSFNDRFWYAAGGYLYDVVDGEQGDDSACRPNQVLAISCAMPSSHQRAGSRCSRSYSSACSRLWAYGHWRLTIPTTRPATMATCAPATRLITRALSGPGS